MKSNTLSFNTLFNDLHNLLTTLLDTNEKRDFFSCLSEIRERAEHSVLFERIHDRYGNDLKTINAIRNILIHKNDWIEVPKQTIEALQSAIQGISAMEKNFHQKAIDIFGKKIYAAKDTDSISDIIEAMASRNFSHIPVYDGKNKFRGVFSLKSLVFWLNKEKYLIDKNILVRDITIDTKNSEYLFIKNTTKVSDIDRYFREYSMKRKKLGAIFLTASGKPDQPIDGIITAWDLPLIYEQISTI